MINEELKNFIEQNCSGIEPSDIIMEAIGKKIEQYGADADEVLAFVEKCSKGPTLEKKSDIARQEKAEARRSADIQNLSNTYVKSTHEAATQITDTLNKNAKSDAKARKKIILSIITIIATIGLGYGAISLYTYYTQLPTSGEYIDLGLPSGTLWCSHDLGAKDYNEIIKETYFLGDPLPKQTTESESSIYYEDHPGFKYNENDELWYRQFPNNTQGTEYDAAYVATNGEACTPTKAQFEELIRYCKIKDVKVKGKGFFYLFIGPNGNKIRFPSGPHYMVSDMVPGSFAEYWTVFFNEICKRNEFFVRCAIRPVKK